MKIYFIFFLLNLITIAPIFSQSNHNFQIGGNTIVIIYNEGEILGTGFICEYSDLVTTAAHLFKNLKEDKKDFIYSTTSDQFNISLIYKDTIMDIAVLSSKNKIEDTPLKLSDEYIFNEYDSLILAGYDRVKSQEAGTDMIVVNPTAILGINTHSVDQNGEKFTFHTMDFSSIAKPGYSGGPIFKWNGKVYGMLLRGQPNKYLTSENNKIINTALVLNWLDEILHSLNSK